MPDETPDAPEVVEEKHFVPPLPAPFVRAKHSETGHLAALGRDALELGMHPGWSEVPGPVPDRPKPAVLRRSGGQKRDDKKPDGDDQPGEKKEE